MKTVQKKKIPISLIIPVKNETGSLASLVASINGQSVAPSEVVLVDGGSTDGTIELARNLTEDLSEYRVIEAGDASPGRGRNIGAENARHEWIAFTDAGIRLSNDWLEKLVEKVKENKPDIIYGNYAPVISNLFEKCAVLAYVPPQPEKGIRGKSIASSLIKKDVWKTAGGFPDLRAAEDLMFMEAAEARGFSVGFAPEAIVYWQLRPDFLSTFRKFVLYSKHNVWAGRQWDWHYGIARQYLVILPFLLLAVFHSGWWLFVILLWLFARTVKRIVLHRREFGIQPLFNPIIFFGVALLILTIDLATFTGWGQAILEKKR